MPASDTQDTRHPDGEVRSAVIRLSRPDGNGDAVIEHAAILAEGTPAAAIRAWIIDHGGRPEVPAATQAARGLYGPPAADARRAPRRYVLPASALESTR